MVLWTGGLEDNVKQHKRHRKRIVKCFYIFSLYVEVNYIHSLIELFRILK